GPRATRFLELAVDPTHDGLRRETRPEMGHPAVGHACGPADHHLALAAHPDRDRPLHRKRIDSRVGNAVPLALPANQVVRPQRAHDLDLLLDALAAGLEALAERFGVDA